MSTLFGPTMNKVIRFFAGMILFGNLGLLAAVSVVVSPATVTVRQKATQTFTATVSGNTNTAVTWSVTGTGNGSITTAGVYTAPAKAGTFTVRATSKADTTKYAQATVTVPSVAVSVSPTSANVAQGATQQFTATVTGTTTTTVTWTTTGGSITTAGKLTAPTTAGTYTVTAKSTADTTKTATASVTVIAGVTVSINPTSVTLAAGSTQVFLATVTGNANTAVTWSVVEGSAGGYIFPSGIYLAPEVPGTYTVKATSVADPSKSASATVTVDGTTAIRAKLAPLEVTLAPSGTQNFQAQFSGYTGSISYSMSSTGGSIQSLGSGAFTYTAPSTAGDYAISVKVSGTTAKVMALVHVRALPSGVSVWVSPSSAQVVPGETQAFTATVNGGGTGNVLWTCSGGAFTQDGTWTAPITAGTYSVTATSADDNTKAATAYVRVPVLLSLGMTSLSLDQGEIYTFNATVQGAPGSGVVWSSSATGAITQDGQFTAPRAAGTYTVTATSIADGSVRATVTVTVASVSIVINNVTNVTAGYQLVCWASVYGTVDWHVNWSVISGGGRFEAQGEYGWIYYSAPGSPGTATIQAQSVADPTQIATAVITINENTTLPIFNSAAITPSALTLGQSFTLSWDVSRADVVWLTDASGNFLDVSGQTSITLKSEDYYDRSQGVVAAGLQASNAAGGTDRVVQATVSAPIIKSVAVTPSLVDQGGSAVLTALFSGGQGRLEPGLGAISSGVPMTIMPDGNPDLRLVVENAYGIKVEQSLVAAVRDSKGVFSSMATLGGDFQYDHQSLLLRDGRLMVLGTGLLSNWDRWEVELVDPVTGTVTTPGAFTRATSGTQVLEHLLQLPDGKVLALGMLSRAQAFDPATGAFSGVSTSFAWNYYRNSGFNLLADGSLLIFGGRHDYSSGYPAYRTTAFRWNPVSGGVTDVASPVFPRAGAKSVRLLDGKVLIVGGANANGFVVQAEVFDPGANAFSAVGSLQRLRLSSDWIGSCSKGIDDLVLQPDGKVLVFDEGIEQFDPATGQFTLMANGAFGPSPFTSSMNSRGMVPVADGRWLAGNPDTCRTIYDPVANRFRQITSADGSLNTSYLSLQPLTDGGAALIGGYDAMVDQHRLVTRFDPKADLVVTPARASVNAGLGLNLTASGSVTWSVNPADGVVDAGGRFTASRPGTYVVTAMGAAGHNAYAWIEVLPAIGVQILPTYFTDNQTTYSWLTIDPYISKGFPRRFIGKVTQASDPTVVWSVEEGSTGGTITTDGLYTPPSTSGTYHIRATSVMDPTKFATIALQVVDPILVTPDSAILSGGTSQTFTAPESVAWAVEKGTITSSGMFTATDTVPLGTWRVWARSTSQVGKMGQSLVTVVSNTALTVSPANPSLPVGGAQSFSAADGGVPIPVRWVASAGSIDANGVFTAPATAGTVTITAIRADDATRRGISTVTVVAPPTISAFSGSPTGVKAGDSVTLSWAVSGASTVTLDPGNLNVTALSNTTVAPSATTTYTLTASNLAGSRSRLATIRVGNTDPLRVATFTVDQARVTRGQSVTLSWNVENADSVSISGLGTVANTGTRTITPDVSVNYVLTASNALYDAKQTVPVQVIQTLRMTRAMIHGFGQLISEDRVYADGTLQTTYIQSDQVGSPNIVSDVTGAVVGRSKNLPFGERFSESWATGKPFLRFAGHENSEESSIYMQARMYLPAYGRFAQPDPQYDQDEDKPDSLNLYGYVQNNPVALVDPTGMVTGDPLEVIQDAGSSLADAWRTNVSDPIQRLGNWSRGLGWVEDRYIPDAMAKIAITDPARYQQLAGRLQLEQAVESMPLMSCGGLAPIGTLTPGFSFDFPGPSAQAVSTNGTVALGTGTTLTIPLPGTVVTMGRSGRGEGSGDGAKKDGMSKSREKQQADVNYITRELKKSGVDPIRIKDELHDVLHGHNYGTKDALKAAREHFLNEGK